MQRLLDTVRGNPALAQQAFEMQSPTKKTKSYEENEAEVDDVTRKLTEFFNTSTHQQSLVLGEYEFVVKNLESTHFIQGSLKVFDPDDIKEQKEGPMTMFKEMYQYFIRALVKIKKGNQEITPEMLTRGMPKYANGYYQALGNALSDYLTLEQLIQLVLDYTAFFTKYDIPAVEKKTK